MPPLGFSCGVFASAIGDCFLQDKASFCGISCRKYWYRTLTIPFSTLVSRSSIDRGDGPETRAPSFVNTAPWQGQTNSCFSSFHGTEQPKCGQIGDSTRTVPS